MKIWLETGSFRFKRKRGCENKVIDQLISAFVLAFIGKIWVSHDAAQTREPLIATTTTSVVCCGKKCHLRNLSKAAV